MIEESFPLVSLFFAQFVFKYILYQTILSPQEILDLKNKVAFQQQKTQRQLANEKKKW